MKVKTWLMNLPPYFYSILVVIIVLYLTLYPDPIPNTDIMLFPHIDKVIHAIMMMGVVMALSFDYIRKGQHIKMSPLILCSFSFATVLFGVIIEFLQDYMNIGRSKDLFDFIANVIGTIVGTVIAKFWLRKIINKLFF